MSDYVTLQKRVKTEQEYVYYNVYFDELVSLKIPPNWEFFDKEHQMEFDESLKIEGFFYIGEL